MDERPNELIMVGVDGSAPSAAALRWAAERAGRTGASVEALIVYEPVTSMTWFTGIHPTAEADRALRDEAEATLAATVKEQLGGTGLEVAQRVLCGSPARELVAASAGADLLVLGAHVAHGWGRLLGSTASACLRHAHCAVVIVPAVPAGAETTASSLSLTPLPD